jgi:hypothetical protein
MPVPINIFSISNIRSEIGDSNINNINSLFTSSLINPAGLDPIYCTSLQDLQANPLTIGKWRNYSNVSITANIFVKVVYSNTGFDAGGVFLEILNSSNIVILTGTTTINGTFIFYNVTSTQSPYTIRISKLDHYTSISEFTVPNSNSVYLNLTISPFITGDRFVLTWGAEPADLDLHLRLPFSYIVPNTMFPDTVYWQAKGHEHQSPWATLDIDDTDGHGPETITIYQRQTGIYHLYVRRWNEVVSVHLSNSGASIHIYNSSGLSNVVYVKDATVLNPQYSIYLLRFWYVGYINGATGIITIVNTIDATIPF